MPLKPTAIDLEKAAKESFFHILEQAEKIGIDPVERPREGAAIFEAVSCYFKNLAPSHAL